jgi:hypothetical protein
MRCVSTYLSMFLLMSCVPAAHAAQPNPVAITELLTRTYIASARCRFLLPDDERELARYFLHAKRALAEIEGPTVTDATLERGRSSGEVAPCSSSTKQQVLSTLAAARRAMMISTVVEPAEMNR